MNQANELYTCEREGAIDSAFVVAFINAFIAKKKASGNGKMWVIVLDNAKIHHSELFNSQLEAWEADNLFIFFLPTYSPHLNKIETLWRKVKYEWLKVEDYTSYDKLKESVQTILSQFGSKYNIRFQT